MAESANFDELLDAHTRRLLNDPAYVRIWHDSQRLPEGERVLALMHGWATVAEQLRGLCREQATFLGGGAIAVECPTCKKRFGIMLQKPVEVPHG